MNCFFSPPSIFKNAWEIEWCYKYYKFYFKELTNFAQIGQFLNVFSFSLELLWLFIVFLTWNTLKLTVSLSSKLPFLHHFNSKSSRKRYEFSLSLYILHDLSLVYLNLWVVDLIWDICCFGDGLDEFLLCLDFWVFLFRLLGFYFCFHGWYGLIVSIDLFDV